MSDNHSGGSLPRLEPKRVHTQAAQGKHHRYSHHLYQHKPYSYYNPDLFKERILSHKTKTKVNAQEPKQQYPLRRFDDSLLQLIQHKTIVHRDNKVVKTQVKKEKEQNKQSTIKQKPFEQFTSEPKLILSEVENYYHNQVKGKPFSHETFVEMVSLLRVNNPLFQRISRVVGQALFKLGFIVTYEPGDVVYKQNMPIRNVGIVLWGQLLFKKKKTKFKFTGYPGSGMGEELVFQKKDKAGRRGVCVEKGQFFTTEGCKALNGSGILFVGEREYYWMREELALRGMKDRAQCFESLLQRVYIRKRDERLLYG